MHKVYGYTRGIHATIEDRRADLHKQTEAICSYAGKLLKGNPHLEMAEIFSDVGTSGYKQSLRDLPAARQLLLKIESTDHLLIGHFGRAFLTHRDLLRNLRIWKRQEISVHLVQQDLRMAIDTPGGLLFTRILQTTINAATLARRELLKGRRTVHKSRDLSQVSATDRTGPPLSS